MLNKLFKQAQEVEFDNTYFKSLCLKKKQLEDRINNAIDCNLDDLLGAQLRTVDQEINLIIINEKKERGMNYHGNKAKRYDRNNKIAYNTDKERIAPIFVNGEVV